MNQITGAGSGIDREIAFELVADGTRVCIADLALKAASEIAHKIVDAGGTAMAVEMNVIDEIQVEACVARVLETYGGVDVWVINTSIQIISSIADLSLENWKKLLAIHLCGAFLTTRACMGEMVKPVRVGSIIYMGSVHSHEGSPLKSSYVTARQGLIGLAKVVARGGAVTVSGRTLSVRALCAPLVDRQISEQAKAPGISKVEVVKSVMLAQTVDGEFTTMGDVAHTTVFLASLSSNALTGQSIVVATAGSCSRLWPKSSPAPVARSGPS